MNWYLTALKKYAVFGGRARRKEYWLFLLFNVIIAMVIVFIEGITGISLLSILYLLAVFLPGLAVGVRRLHDTNRSGWWLFLSLLPLLGAIILTVFLCQDSQDEENEYGPNPKMDPPI